MATYPAKMVDAQVDLIAIKNRGEKQKPRRMARGFLAGSSWLLHIKQICIENQERIRRGAALKGCVKLDSPLYGIAARKLKKS